MLTQLKIETPVLRPAGDAFAGKTPAPGLGIRPPGVRPEVQLLLACARTVIDEATAERIREILRGDLDWSYITEQGERHCVMSLLFQSLNDVCRELVPANVLKDLREYTNANAHYNLYRTGELIKLLRLFEANSIPALPFKGPVLSASAYGNLALREYGDLDILVRPQDVPTTKELLLSGGYGLVKSLKRTQTNARFAPRNKDLIFDSADGRVRVELHWRLTGKHFDFPLDLDSLWERLGSVSLAGSMVRALAPEDLLLYLCMHGSRHGWERLLWISDVAELLRTHTMDWDSIIDKARKLGSRRTLALGLILVRDLLGVELPQDVWRRVQVEPGTELLGLRLRESLFESIQGDRGISYWHGIHLRMRERLLDRLRLHLHYYHRYFRLAVVPNKRDHAILELPAALSFLYYLLRPLRLVKSFGIPQLKKGPRRDGKTG